MTGNKCKSNQQQNGASAQVSVTSFSKLSFSRQLTSAHEQADTSCYHLHAPKALPTASFGSLHKPLKPDHSMLAQ